MNHLSELGLPIIGARGIALIHHVNVPKDISYRVYKEVHRTATMLFGLAFIDTDGKQATRYEHFCVCKPSFATKLRSWYGSVVVKTRSWSTPKISYRGTVCMMVEYNHDSGSDVYRMCQPGTSRMHCTR